MSKKIVKPSKQFTGTLFASSKPDVLDGPFFVLDEEHPKHHMVVTLGEPGDKHHLVLYRKGKDGKPTAQRSGEGQMWSTDNGGDDAKPGYRAVINIGKQAIRLAGWKQDGERIWFKPDSRVERALPSI